MSTDTALNKISSIPLILRIACLASGGLGLLQLVAIVFSFVSPGVEGVTIKSPILAAVMGLVHLALAWGIFKRFFWVIPLIVLLPLVQYGVLYLEIGFPEQRQLEMNLINIGVWALIFCVYLFCFKTYKYFCHAENA